MIHEIAPEWEADRFVALMKWVEGMPLADLAGVVPIHAEDIGEDSAESLSLHWLLALCGALGQLRRAGLVHGDVSPRNVIMQGGSVTLTDYDTVPWLHEVLSAYPGARHGNAETRGLDSDFALQT